MQVRVFEAEDMNSGLRLVRKELGPDALILSTKTVKNGKLGLLGKSTIEITAAIDSSWPEDHPASGQDSSPQQDSTAFKPASPTKRIDVTVGSNEPAIDYVDTAAAQNEAREIRQMLTSSDISDTTDQALRSEVKELKELVEHLAGRLKDNGSDPEVQFEGHLDNGSTGESIHKKLQSLPGTREPVLNLLLQHGIEGEVALGIVDFIRKNLSPEDFSSIHAVRKLMIQVITDLIDVQPTGFDSTEKQIRLALIGPTGVGKTTTLAKLAAHYLANYSDSIALVTIDTYRIAAVEQIKVYGEIMHLPVEVVISPEQLEEALQKHKDKKLILIDTAGRSPKDTLSAIELSLFLRPDLDIEKHLVLSAATRDKELVDTISHFEKVGIDRTIFTKVDECSTSGVILNVQSQSGYPLSYITNGQRVPEDLLQITKRSVAEFIMTPTEGIPNE